MKNVKMEKQKYQQQETHGKTTNQTNNEGKQQTDNKALLSPKAGERECAKRLASEPFEIRHFGRSSSPTFHKIPHLSETLDHAE